MIGKHTRIFLTVAMGLLFACQSHGQMKTIVYKESLEDFPNPERGFYIPKGGKPGELSLEELKILRTTPSLKSSDPDGSKASYSVRVSLLYRGYSLSSFRNAPITEDYLQKIRTDLKIIRQAGLKVILRFAYIDETKPGNCPDKEKICPPYGDAPKPVVLQHIAQLKPLFTENADVIAVVQQGFIGIWGENYYTDYFGDASANGAGFVPDSSWQDRNEVLRALLEALPKDRMVMVRTPQIKQRYVYGPTAPVTAFPLTQKEAFSSDDKARIAFHNDCFLASKDDYGTFDDYGNADLPNQSTNRTLRQYFEADSRYVAVGGETCDDAFSPENDCAPVGHAEQEMAAMHYSWLNAAYNNRVNNDWETQGCMMNIKRQLGYRFVLQKAILPQKLKAGQSFSVQLDLKNIGFASPYNPRPFKLVLRQVQTKDTISLTSKADVRYWFTGLVQFKETFTLPAAAKPGQYEVLVQLPDARASIAHRPEYSIRFANEGTWEEETGYNTLHHVITVNF